MSRARNLKPAFFRNEELAELSFEYRILFQGLWCLADREGRLEYRPKRIKAEVFPYDDVDVVKGLDELSARGFIQLYPSRQVQYIQVVAFLKHQNPHCKESASTIPAPCKDSAGRKNTGSRPADSLNPITDSLNGAAQPPAAARAKKAKVGEVTLAEWVLALPESEEIIGPNDPIYRWALDVGLPSEWIALAWTAFENKYGESDKTYSDWRKTFRNAVKGDWMHLWRADPQGRGWTLTTAGQMAEREMSA